MTISEKRPLHVDRESLNVTIYTKNLRLTGSIHVPIKGRMSDYLNKTLHGSDTFIPLTNATCYDMEGNLLQHSKYLAVNKLQIQLVMPTYEEE